MRYVVEDFAKKVDMLMAEKGLMVIDLARISRLSPQSITQIRRINNPRPRTVRRIAHGLGVPVSFFYDE